MSETKFHAFEVSGLEPIRINGITAGKFNLRDGYKRFVETIVLPLGDNANVENDVVDDIHAAYVSKGCRKVEVIYLTSGVPHRLTWSID